MIIVRKEHRVLIQGEAPRARLLDEFRRDRTSVLFATASFWQGVDVPSAIRALGSTIYHFHAKDSALDPQNVALNGVIVGKPYTEMASRAWLFRTVGWGHDLLVWKQIVSALRLAGYDHVISIEHEDALASLDEGLMGAVDILKRAILGEPPVDAWWT